MELGNLSHRVVLPSSYISGPRYMNQRFQDAIAVAHHYKGFDLFITFTCNANCVTGEATLTLEQDSYSRPLAFEAGILSMGVDQSRFSDRRLNLPS